MSSFENFVQCRVVTPFTAAATEIGLFVAEAPYRLPAEDGGVLVLTDSPYRPSVLEVIRYGRRSGMALYEVSRAQEGTTARDWTGVAFCYQALTAGELAQLLGQKADLSALDELREDAETALDTKVDKIAGKGLSTNDYTTAEKNKLANANLTALAGLTGAADRLPYFTGAGALSLATLTAAARTLLAATNAAGQRSALGLGSAAVATLTTSNLDTTVDRVLKVGDLNIGRPAVPATVFATVADWAKPAGWSGFVRKEGSVGWPGGVGGPDYIYYSIVGRRDVSGGYAGIAATQGSPRRAYIGFSDNSEVAPTWFEVFHTGNQLSLGTTAESARTAMGLGTAATAQAATSSTDTTSGALMRVGAFGIGGAGILTLDPNTLTHSQVFNTHSQAVNVPMLNAGGFGFHIQHSTAGYATQYWAANSASQRVFMRVQRAGDWLEWCELYTTGNQLSLGTTAASGRAALGLGTAATKDIADLLSAETGRVAPTGYCGFGGISSGGVLWDWNWDATVTGVSRINAAGNPSDYPAQLRFGEILTLRSGDTALQIGGYHGGSAGSRLRLMARHGVVGNPESTSYIRGREFIEVYHAGVSDALPISGSLSPSTDNNRTLGEANKRWDTAHLGTAPIVTSDRDAKQDILPIDDAVLDAWATLGYMQYRLKDAVAVKGEEARIHAGLIAQDIKEAFESAGLDPFKYGVLCYDEWDDEVVEHPAEYEQIEIPAEYEQIEVPAVLDDEGNEVEPARIEQGDLIQEARYEQGALIKEAWTEVVREAGHRYSVRYEEAFALECALQRRTTQRLEQRLAALEAA